MKLSVLIGSRFLDLSCSWNRLVDISFRIYEMLRLRHAPFSDIQEHKWLACKLPFNCQLLNSVFLSFFLKLSFLSLKHFFPVWARLQDWPLPVDFSPQLFVILACLWTGFLKWKCIQSFMLYKSSWVVYGSLTSFMYFVSHRKFLVQIV